MQAFEPQLSV